MSVAATFPIMMSLFSKSIFNDFSWLFSLLYLIWVTIAVPRNIMRKKVMH